MKKISIIEMKKYNYYSSIRKNNKLQQLIISHIPIKTNHVIRLYDVYDASLRIYELHRKTRKQLQLTNGSVSNVN